MKGRVRPLLNPRESTRLRGQDTELRAGVREPADVVRMPTEMEEGSVPVKACRVK